MRILRVFYVPRRWCSVNQNEDRLTRYSMYWHEGIMFTSVGVFRLMKDRQFLFWNEKVLTYSISKKL